MTRTYASTFSNIVWLAYLAFALVFVQGARLHVHAYNHDSSISDHQHVTQVHFEFSNPEIAYSDEAAQIDLSQHGLEKKLNLGSISVALFAVLLLLLPLQLLAKISWRRYRLFLPVFLLRSLRPPLRAQPR